MNKEEITEGNKLIAEFMEAHQDVYGKWFYKNYINGISFLGYELKEFKYHTSWDWLMPVVEKIEENYEINMTDIFCRIILSKDGYALSSIKKDADTKIEAVWLAVVEFIKWYNQNKTK